MTPQQKAPMRMSHRGFFMPHTLSETAFFVVNSDAALAAAHVVHDLSVGRGVAFFTRVEVRLDGL